MNARLSLALLTLTGLFWADSSSFAAPPAHKPQVLFLSQSVGFLHGSVNRDKNTLAPAEIAMTQLGRSTRLFDVHCTQDATDDFTKANLANYDIVMLYTTGDLPIFAADFDYFWREWLPQKGHGVIAFHSATDTFHDFEPYWDLIGGTFNGHPWGYSKTKTVTIAVHDTKHPTSRPFGKEFQFQDEIYQYKHWQPEKVHVLMSLDMEKCDPKMPYQVPVAWVKNVGQGKLFYTNLGHSEGTWHNKMFLKSVEGGIRWILGLEEGDATPNPEVSKAEEAKAKAAAGKVPAPKVGSRK
jgi:type 1 glutamine amidotransferase